MHRLAEALGPVAEHRPLTPESLSHGPAYAPTSAGGPHLPFGADPAAQLRWAQKVEAIGRLTARVVHEINNQVTLMLGRTTLLLQRGEALPAGRAQVEELHRAAERIARLMRQWLALGRRDGATPRR